MSDFLPRITLNELWDEILRLHWTYFDSEESIVKLENRKKLEDCLNQFLCIVPHNRKFLLSETAKVLNQSIQDLEGFTAQNAITAFESINQYANNLFTKPWRKEYRSLKLYSGFYQHDIKSNLLGAEVLFEAMGYRRLTENILVLDGPICPDQVTNVSRDAMLAYIELKIMNHIYTALDAIGINCSWLDIYLHRQKYTGGSTHAIKSIAFAFDEKRYRTRHKTMTGDNYGCIEVQPSPNYFATNTQFCPAMCQCSHYQQVPSVSRHRQANDMYSVPEHNQQPSRMNLVYNNMAYPSNYHHNHHHSREVPMSHSRSLEHYSEPDHNIYLQRHSFDHQQQPCTAHNQYHRSHQLQQQHQCYQQNQPQQNFYESPYDCIDNSSMGGGSSTISYAAVAANTASRTVTAGGSINCNLNSNASYADTYNVSGNRIPLPLNISNQLSTYDNLQSSNYNGSQDPTYAHILDQHLYSSVSKLPQDCVTNPPGSCDQFHNPLSVKESMQRQRLCQSEQLINFEESTSTSLQQQLEPTNQYHKSCERSNHTVNDHCNMRNIMELSGSISQQDCIGGKFLQNDDAHVYAKPIPKGNRKQNILSLRKYPYNFGEGGDTTDISYESANDEFVNIPCHEHERIHVSSPSQFTKNQDGVGSMEEWNYIYQNLEKNGYSKDLGERNDLLVQSLDLNSMNINNDNSPSQSSSTEKRKSIYQESERTNTIQQQQQQERKQEDKTFENTKYLSKNNTTMESSASVGSSANIIQKQKILVDNNARKIKSSLKQTNLTSKPNTASSQTTNINHYSNKFQSKPNDNKTLPKAVNNNNNNNNDALKNTGNGTSIRKTSSSKKSPSIGSTNSPPSLSTQIIATSANEWSCKFCTFLNPNSKTICEMCSKSKDFKLDSSKTSTSTTETTLAHNTPTCA